MPEYLYLCETNNQEFETEHSIKVELEECQVCKEKGLPNHKPKRLIAGRTAARVELSGREYTDKIKSDAAAYKKHVYSNETAYSNLIGESKYQSIQSDMDKRRR